MDARLEDLVVWITGASGGIGEALAEGFAAEGCRLVLQAGTRTQPLRAFVERAGLTDRAFVMGGDVTSAAAQEAAARAGRERFGRLDVCVSNAGIWPAEAVPLQEMDPERVRRVLEVNLLGAVWTARAFLRELAVTGPRTDGRGASVCFVGSTAGRFGEAHHAEYSVSKAGLYGLVRSLKNEIVRLDPWGRVNMVEPGWTVTPMAEATLEEPGVVASVVATMPVRQLARPRDIADAVQFLCAPGLARHVSGEVLTVAGGMEGRVQWGPEAVDTGRVRARMREP
jgi:3-oxoacyl-[acyl-carrier protein] reductase